MTDLSAPTDVSGEIVDEWLRTEVEPLRDLLRADTAMHGSIEAMKFEIPDDRIESAGRRLAIGIVARRLRLYPAQFGAWLSAATYGTPLGNSEMPVQRNVDSLVGQPASPKPDTHLYGLVAEHILGELLLTVDRGQGLPAHVERHEWAVTDPGGDAVAVYSTDGGLSFTLWESKAVTGATVLLTTIVGEASEQMELRGWEYLGRWAPVAQRLHDPDLAAFFLAMPDIWADADTRAGAGISLSTHTAKFTPTCFSGLSRRFKIPDTNKHGLLIGATDFTNLSKRVRKEMWRGALWIAP